LSSDITAARSGGSESSPAVGQRWGISTKFVVAVGFGRSGTYIVGVEIVMGLLGKLVAVGCRLENLHRAGQSVMVGLGSIAAVVVTLVDGQRRLIRSTSAASRSRWDS